MPNRPPSAFSMGQRVRVALAGGGRTPREGTVRDIVWHFQAERYDYYLEADGRKVPRRYAEGDLEAAE
jgi:hypothetical protein